MDVKTDVKTIAPRFSLHLPVRYRRVGETIWHDSTTKNVSASGALLYCDQPLSPGVRLELDITMVAAFPLKASRIRTTSIVLRQSEDANHLVTTVKHESYDLHQQA